MRNTRLFWTLAASLALASNCGTDPPRQDGGADGSLDGSLDDGSTAETGAETGAPSDVTTPTCTGGFALEAGTMPAYDPMQIMAGRSTAGRLSAAQLPRNTSGLLEHKEGDFVLANERIAVVVEAARASAGYDPWGGKIVGLSLVRDRAMVDGADFNEAITTMGRFTLRAESVGVINDGRNGMPAVVRAVGVTAAVPFVDEFARAIAGQPLGGFRAAFEYQLAPGAEHVDVFLLVNHERTADTQVALSLHGFFQRYRMPLWFQDAGFTSTPEANRIQPLIGFVNDAGASYAWIDPNGNVNHFLSVSGFDSFEATPYTMPACTQFRRHVARVVVGGPGVDGLGSALARLRMQTQREIRGTVADAAGMAATGARVHATSADGMRYLTRVPVDAMGNFAIHVPSAMPVRLVAWRDGDGPSPTVDVPAATATAMLRLPPAGTLDIAVTDDMMAPLPARILVEPVSGSPPSLPGSHGEFTPGNRRNHVLFPVDGRASVRVPVGRYRVIAGRGFEYEIATQEVDVTAGGTQMVRPVIRRSVDTTGAMSGDFHIHTNRSPDAPDPGRFKLASMAADGLEIAVRTDHEYVMDFEPLIAEMNLGQWMYGVPALELTTFTWGHFNVLPLTPRTDQPNNGTFQWANRLPPAVFRDVRARPERPTIIINHPTGTAANGAYFTASRLNPDSGAPGRMDYWDTEFTVVEVFNESSFEQNRMASVRDWFSLLRTGRRVWAVGSSDSHAVLPSSATGYPRTYLLTGHDNPRMLTANSVRDTVAQGRATISGGAYVTATVMGSTTGPGQEAMGVGPMANVEVRVQAPAWVRLTELETIVDGVSTGRRPIPAAMGMSAERLRQTISVPVAATGSWVLFVAHGQELTPMYPAREAFGATNPIYLRR
jgi:hypothetical protein